MTRKETRGREEKRGRRGGGELDGSTSHHALKVCVVVGGAVQASFGTAHEQKAGETNKGRKKKKKTGPGTSKCVRYINAMKVPFFFFPR